MLAYQLMGAFLGFAMLIELTLLFGVAGGTSYELPAGSDEGQHPVVALEGDFVSGHS